MKYPKKQIAIIPISCCLLATLVRAQDPASDPRYIPPPTPTITDPKNNQAQQSPTTNIAGRTAVITDGDEPVPNEEDVLPLGSTRKTANGEEEVLRETMGKRYWYNKAMDVGLPSHEGKKLTAHQMLKMGIDPNYQEPDPSTIIPDCIYTKGFRDPDRCFEFTNGKTRGRLIYKRGDNSEILKKLRQKYGVREYGTK
jgi:hypothetical protein